MTQSKEHQSLEIATAIPWTRWLEILEPIRDYPHAEMAKEVVKHIKQKGQCESPEMWAQYVTGTYERHIGRRVRGQRCDLTYSATVSKTLLGSMDEVLNRWLTWNKDKTEYHGHVALSISSSQTLKWRYWRAKLSDGSVISVNIQDKPNSDKSNLAINHDKLKSLEEADDWRVFWKTFLIENMSKEKDAT